VSSIVVRLVAVVTQGRWSVVHVSFYAAVNVLGLAAEHEEFDQWRLKFEQDLNEDGITAFGRVVPSTTKNTRDLKGYAAVEFSHDFCSFARFSASKQCSRLGWSSLHPASRMAGQALLNGKMPSI